MNCNNLDTVDWKRDKNGIPVRVVAIEYDPNRSANLALLNYADGEKTYILAPNGLAVGDTVVSGPEADIKLGNCLPMFNIPLGTVIHNIEMKIGKGAQMVRSAGSAAQLMAKDGNHVLVKLPSGEVRRFSKDCRACIGQVGNTEYGSQKMGKAGRARWHGIRPSVRGVAMNRSLQKHRLSGIFLSSMITYYGQVTSFILLNLSRFVSPCWRELVARALSMRI